MVRNILVLIAIFIGFNSQAQQPPKFRVIALYENGGHHIAYSKAAQVWLNQQAIDNNFTIDYIQDTNTIDSAFLSRYQLFIQLDFPPYGWKEKAVKAFEQYIETGKGGWIGFHHATLLGEFDNFPIWPWFWRFMGEIRFKNYIPDFAAGIVNIEKQQHPIMKGLPAQFHIEKEEWYTYDQSPRPKVTVLASVDEGSYTPESKIKMGDHPVIWTNPAVKARNVYIFMGHSPTLFDNENYKMLFRNSILWAAGFQP